MCKICTNFWFFITEFCDVWPNKRSWNPSTCSKCLLQRISNPWITLSESILLFVMFSKSSFVTGSFVFWKEVVYPSFSHQFYFLYLHQLFVSQFPQYSLLRYTLEIIPYSPWSLLLLSHAYPFLDQLFLSMASFSFWDLVNNISSLLEFFVLDWNFYQLALK